jgi:hypothetical protein
MVLRDVHQSLRHQQLQHPRQLKQGLLCVALNLLLAACCLVSRTVWCAVLSAAAVLQARDEASMRPSVARKLNEKIRALEGELELLRTNKKVKDLEKKVQVRLAFSSSSSSGGGTLKHQHKTHSWAQQEWRGCLKLSQEAGKGCACSA